MSCTKTVWVISTISYNNFIALSLFWLPVLQNLKPLSNLLGNTKIMSKQSHIIAVWAKIDILVILIIYQYGLVAGRFRENEAKRVHKIIDFYSKFESDIRILVLFILYLLKWCHNRYQHFKIFISSKFVLLKLIKMLLLIF